MFIEVFSQVAILFILTCLGIVFAKLDILSDKGVKDITDIVLFTVTPCVIIKSFIREFDRSSFNKLLLSFAVSIAVHIAVIIIARIVLPSKDRARKGVLQYGTVFANCGYMSLPLQQALIGDEGVFYAASFIAVFNIFSWTYGVMLMSGDKKSIFSKKIILNPGVISTVIGLIIFIFSVPVPNIISEPIGYMAALNTPLPMIVIGYHLAKSDFVKYLKDIKCLLAVALRLVIIPLCALGIMYLCGLRGVLLLSTVISCCSPVAANTTMFAAKYGGDTSLSVSMVSISTLLSFITMPLIIMLTQTLA